MFASIFIVNGGSGLVRTLITDAGLGQAQLLALLLAIIVVMGFVLDWISVVLIAIPLLDPVVRAAGIDPIWFGVMVCVALQTSYLTPPIAPTIFYLRSIAPPEMTYGQMYRGVAPFVAAQLLVLLIVAFFPATAIWLPDVLFGGF
jgi:TRAP-type mannitol/chloroaromatic compound transport system permease large subunit